MCSLTHFYLLASSEVALLYFLICEAKKIGDITFPITRRKLIQSCPPIDAILSEIVFTVTIYNPFLRDIVPVFHLELSRCYR